MSQKTFHTCMRILIPVIIILLVVNLIAATIIAFLLVPNKNDVSAATVDQDVESTEPSEFSQNDDDIVHSNVTNSNTDYSENCLENRYKSVFEWQRYTGDFGVEQLYFLKEQCDIYEIPIEVMLSIICNESSFRSTAKAETSSASGYCQIVKGTAKWIYEDKLNRGQYDVDNHTEIMTSDWKLNIEIGCRLMYCLYWNSNQSWDIAIQKYYGASDYSECEAYLDRVNAHMYELFGVTTNDLL